MNTEIEPAVSRTDKALTSVQRRIGPRNRQQADNLKRHDSYQAAGATADFIASLMPRKSA